MQGQMLQRFTDRLGIQRQGEGRQALLVQFIHRVVIGAVKITAQQVIPGIALVLHDADHPTHRHAHQRQRVAGQHQRTFYRLRHHLRRAGRLQFFEITVVLCAHDDRHLRCMRTRVVKNFQRALEFHIGDNDCACARQTRRHEGLQPRRVAENHRVPGCGRLPHPVRVEVERHVGNAFTFQHARQVLATAAIAANNDVLVGVDRLARDGGHLQGLLEPFAGDQLHDDAVAVHDDEWRGQHR
jgi:hypothetical protein